MSFLGEFGETGFGGFVADSLGGFVDDFLGFRQRLYNRGSDHARKEFGFLNSYYYTNTPRFKFQYFAVINFNSLAVDMNGEPFVEKFFKNEEKGMLVPLMQSVQLPNMTVESKVLNQYNRKRISQSKLKYDPINITMHDVVDGKTLRLWEMYSEYYFNDAIDKLLSDDRKTYVRKVLDDTGDLRNWCKSDYSALTDKHDHSAFGFSPNTKGALINSIEIYQTHAGRWSKVMLVNPKITTFKHDALEFASEAELVKMEYTFDYEYAIYHNFSTEFSSDDLKNHLDHERKDILETKHNPPKPEFHPPIRSKDREVQPLADSEGFLPNNSVLGNLQRSVTSLIKMSPSLVSETVSSSLIAGEFVPPEANPLDSAKSLTGNLVSGSKTVGAKNIGSTAGGAVNLGLGGLRK